MRKESRRAHEELICTILSAVYHQAASRGISRKKLWKLTGIPPSRIISMLTGDGTIPIKDIARLEIALGVRFRFEVEPLREGN